jgi:3-carboxy-cis,cis-muconate cycloisomerase
MTISPFDSQMFGELFGDPEVAELFSDTSVIAAMVDVETALAKTQARVGLIPQKAYDRIAQGLQAFSPDPARLARSTASFGVPVPALLQAAREVLGEAAGSYLHWGATSQDIVDTAMVLRLSKIMVILENRIVAVREEIEGLAAVHRATLMASRTRWQQAVPTTFGHKLAQWAEAMKRHLKRWEQLRPRLLVLSLGGAGGTLAALGDKAREVEKQMAAELRLNLSPGPWHTQRDSIAELAGWLSMLTGSLGKIGQDLLLMAQTEVAEIRFSTGGGSSTMPQKSNPVGAEVLVSLSRLNAGLVGLVHQGQIQEHERGGSGWMLEWLVLPQMVMAAAVNLKHLDWLLGAMEVDAGRMKINLEQSNGMVLAEAAVFALAAHMPKPAAQDLVKAACQESRRTKEHMVDILSRQVDLPVDWQRLKDPINYTGIATDRKTNA